MAAQTTREATKPVIFDTPAPTAAPVDAEKVHYGAFVGMIDQSSAYRMSHWLGAVSQDGKVRLHLLFQSIGGTVADGLFMYSLLSSLPFDVTIYNGGSVASIAALAFLGAKKRKVSRHGTFMIHRTTYTSMSPSTRSKLGAVGDSLAIDDQRTEMILKKHLRLDTGALGRSRSQ